MILFNDDVIRDLDDSRIHPNETLMEYVSTRSKPEIVRARSVLNRLFAAYPKTDRNRLYSELKSDNDSQQYGALHQLVLYHLLQNQGFDVIPERTVASGSTPDFVIDAAGMEVIVEAVLDSGESNDEQRFYELTYNARKHVHQPNFMLSVSNYRVSTTTPSAKKLARFLNALFRKLDWAAERKKLESSTLDEDPFIYDDDKGTVIEFKCIPILTDQGYPDTLIASQMNGAYWIDLSRPKSIIRKKDKQHRKSGLPQVISYACNDPHLAGSQNNDAIVRALYGELQYAIPRDQKTGELLPKQGFPKRNDDGLWIPTDKRSVDNPRLVIWLDNLHPWSVNKSSCTLWVNPHEGLDSIEENWVGSIARVNTDGELIVEQGRSLADIIEWNKEE